MERGGGTQFDPHILGIFIENVGEKTHNDVGAQEESIDPENASETHLPGASSNPIPSSPESTPSLNK
jgi:hypothetical protein